VPCLNWSLQARCDTLAFLNRRLSRFGAVMPSTQSQQFRLNGLLPTLKELGIGFVPYSPLGRGLLTATVTETFEPGDFRPFLPRFDEHNLDSNRAVADVISLVADRHGVSAAQISIAWVLGIAENVVPIPGTRSLERLTENLGAATVVLTHEDRLELEHAADGVSGERYPDFLQELVDK
jgi:aryl-alcohol dehydrogenase-like predicted oxidoreductase